MTVWKYTLESANEVSSSAGRRFVFEVPKGAKFLDAQAKGGEGHAWALVDPEKEKEERNLVVFGTGHDIPESLDLDYIGSFQIMGSLIFHVFEENN